MKFITGSTSKALTLKSSNSPGNSEVMMKGSEREVMKYNQPTQELGMSDLIKQHTSGDRFMYAAISHKADDNHNSMLSRLIRHTAISNRSPIPEKKLPCIPLYEEVETFPLSGIVNKTGKAYIHIVEVLVVFAPLVAPDSDYTQVKMAIMDSRFIDNRSIVKSFSAASNIVTKGSLKLSYCFPRAEVNKISLVVSRDAAFLQAGSQWGVLQLQVSMEDMDFPIQTDVMKVHAVNDLVGGLLENPDVSPNHLDVTMSEHDRIRLQQMYLNGDLRDASEAIAGKQEVTKYSKSILSKPKGKEFNTSAKGWDFMNGSRSLGAAGDNSVDPSDDGYETAGPGSIGDSDDDDDASPNLRPVNPPSYPLRSALKKTLQFQEPGSPKERVVEVIDTDVPELAQPINPFR